MGKSRTPPKAKIMTKKTRQYDGMSWGGCHISGLYVHVHGSTTSTTFLLGSDLDLVSQHTVSLRPQSPWVPETAKRPQRYCCENGANGSRIVTNNLLYVTGCCFETQPNSIYPSILHRWGRHLAHPGGSRGHLRDILPPVCPGFSRGPPNSGTCPEPLTNEASGWHSN